MSFNGGLWRVPKLMRWWLVAFGVSLSAHALVTWHVGGELDQAPAPMTVQAKLALAPPLPEEPPQRLKFERPPEVDPPATLIANRSTLAVPTVPRPSLRAVRGGRLPGLGPGLAVPGPPAQRVGTGLGDGADQFAAYVEELREAGLDVVFLIDATGSMGWALDEVKRRVRDMIEWVRELVPIARFGMVAYRDLGDPEFAVRAQPLTYSTAKLTRFLGSFTAAGGGSLGEGILAGMRVAANEAGWRASGKRLVILIGDAPPHRHEAEELLRLVAGFRNQGGQVTALDVSDEANPALLEARLRRKVNRAMYRGSPSYDFTRIAEAGGGDAATLDGDLRLVRRVVTLIFGNAFSDDLRMALDAMEVPAPAHRGVDAPGRGDLPTGHQAGEPTALRASRGRDAPAAWIVAPPQRIPGASFRLVNGLIASLCAWSSKGPPWVLAARIAPPVPLAPGIGWAQATSPGARASRPRLGSWIALSTGRVGTCSMRAS